MKNSTYSSDSINSTCKIAVGNSCISGFNWPQRFTAYILHNTCITVNTTNNIKFKMSSSVSSNKNFTSKWKPNFRLLEMFCANHVCTVSVWNDFFYNCAT